VWAPACRGFQLQDPFAVSLLQAGRSGLLCNHRDPTIGELAEELQLPLRTVQRLAETQVHLRDRHSIFKPY